jgi:hypothetical protein
MILTALTVLGSAITLLAVLGGRATDATRRVGTIPTLLIVAILALSVQVTHFIEHLVQLGYWFAHRGEAPFLTPWAASAARSISGASLGVEVLHLVGNMAFLGGLALLWRLVRQDPNRSPNVRTALIVQSAHVAEHVMLTASVAISGSALGVSTLFGALTPGPGAWTYRVWLHFLVNLAVTFSAVRAVAGIADDEPATRHRVRSLAA